MLVFYSELTHGPPGICLYNSAKKQSGRKWQTPLNSLYGVSGRNVPFLHPFLHPHPLQWDAAAPPSRGAILCQPLPGMWAGCRTALANRMHACSKPGGGSATPGKKSGLLACRGVRAPAAISPVVQSRLRGGRETSQGRQSACSAGSCPPTHERTPPRTEEPPSGATGS